MNSLLYFIITFSILGSISTDIHSMAGFGGQGAVQQGGLMKMPTEAEMKEINDFLATLSEDELKELAKLGEEIIATAEKEGVPLFYPDPQAPTFDPAPSVKPTESIIKKPEPIKPTKKIEQSTGKANQNILKNLIKIMNDIRKKVATDPLLNDSLRPLNQPINTFLYHLNVATDNKIAHYLADKEFETLNNLLKKLEKELEELNNNFDVPIKDTIKISPYRKAIKTAEKVLDKIIMLLQNSFFEKNINAELEKLIKKYDPEALKIKKELEMQERSAHEATKKIPVTNTGRPAALSSRTMVDNAVQQPFNINHMNQPLKIPNVIEKDKKERPFKQEKPLQIVKSNEKKQNTSQKVKPTLADLENNVKMQFDRVEASLTPHKQAFVKYFAENQIIGEEPEWLKQPLNDINFELKKLKKAVSKWHDSLEKNAQNSNDYRVKIKPLQDFYQSEKHKNIKLVHNQIKGSSGTRRISLDGNLKQFKSFMDDIEKKLTGNQS